MRQQGVRCVSRKLIQLTPRDNLRRLTDRIATLNEADVETLLVSGGGGGVEAAGDQEHSGSVVVVVGEAAEPLRALPGDVDLDVFLSHREHVRESLLLPLGEVLPPGAENVADPVERVASFSPVFEGGRHTSAC